jgi:hypothetical protein
MANSFPIIGNERGGSKSRAPLISSRPALPPWTTSQRKWLQAQITLSTLFRKGFRKEEIGTGMRLSLHSSPLSTRYIPYPIIPTPPISESHSSLTRIYTHLHEQLNEAGWLDDLYDSAKGVYSRQLLDDDFT